MPCLPAYCLREFHARQRAGRAKAKGSEGEQEGGGEDKKTPMAGEAGANVKGGKAEATSALSTETAASARTAQPVLTDEDLYDF